MISEFILSSELIKNYLPYISFYFPLGILGLFRWSIWIFKKIVGLLYKPIKGQAPNYSLSVITPVYNENPKVFLMALNSWKENRPDEIIAVIDNSDKINIDVFKKFSKDFKNAKLIITGVPGKRSALAEGIKASSGKISALVDSDTIWEKKLKRKILVPFADNSVGGVATRQEVLEDKTIAQSIFNLNLSNRYFNEFPFLAVVGDGLICISGRTAVYRREALIKIVNQMQEEKFLGEPCISGEDKCLTNLIQESGWKVRYLMNAVVKTPGVPDIKTFFKQQTRWLRNSWREDLKSIFSLWIWRNEVMLALYIIDKFIQPFFLIFGFLFFVFATIAGHWPVVVIIALWITTSRAIKYINHFRRHPLDIFIMPVFILFSYALAFLKIYALFTVKKQGWITRWDKNRFLKSGAILTFIGYSSVIMIFIIMASYVGNLRTFNITLIYGAVMATIILMQIVSEYDKKIKISRFVSKNRSIVNKN